MAHHRQLFHFRFPWSAPENPPPARRPTRSQSTQPSTKTQTPAQPTKTQTQSQPTKTRPSNKTQIPSQPTSSPQTQKPPFAAGIAQPQTSPKTESQSQPTSSAATRSQTSSQTASTSRAPSQAPPASPSKSPSRKSTETITPADPASSPQARIPIQASAESQTSRKATRKTTSRVSSPSRKATQAQPADGAVYLSLSSSEKSQPTNQLKSQFPSSSTLPSSTSQQESKGKVSQKPLQEPQSKLETISGSRSGSLNNIPEQIPSQTEIRAQNELSKDSLPVVSGGPEPNLELEVNSKGEERKEILHEPPKEEMIKGLSDGEPKQKMITEVVGSEKQVKDAQNVTFQERERQQKQETMNRKDKVNSKSHIGRQFQSSTSSDANISNVSIQKPVSSAEDKQATLQKDSREDIPNLGQQLASEHQIDGIPVSVVTLSGESRGSTMHLSSDPANRETSIHIHRGNKINPDDNPETTIDGDLKTRAKQFNEYGKSEALRPRAYVNSNVQSVNNSIVFNSSITKRDPGVEVVFSHHAAESIKGNGKSKALQIHKAEFTSIPAEKVTHEHIVNRRCLAESSHSDPNNPAKPQRHGCLYNYGEKSKDMYY